jgi:hypothetical protein
VYLPNQAQGQGKALVEPLKSVVEGGDVVGHLYDIVHRDAGDLVVLVEKKVRERGLRTLNLGGQYRLFPDVEVQKELRVGKKGRHSIEPSEGPICPLHTVVDFGAKTEILGRRKRVGDEGAYLLAHARRSNVAPGGLAHPTKAGFIRPRLVFLNQK